MMNNMADPKVDDKDLLVQDEDLSVTYRLRRCCCGSPKRIMIAVAVLLVVGGIIFAVAFVLTRPKICETALCYNISRVISNQLDKSVDPCNDFYSYACGGFFKEHKLFPNESQINAFTILNEKNLEVLRHALQNISVYSKDSSISKTAKIYNSCMNISSINERGARPLADLIEKYGGWSVTGNGTNSWSVAEKMGRVLRDLNVQTLLSLSVGTDLMDSKSHILSISPSSLGMSATFFTSDDKDSKKIQNAYKTYMKTIADLLGGGTESHTKMTKIYDFEETLANTKTGNFYSEDLVEIVKEHHRSGRSLDSIDSTIGVFCTKTDFQEDFILQWLKFAFSHQGLTFDSSEKVFYVREKDGDAPIFKGIANAYHAADEATVKDYIMWRVVDNFVGAMPDKFVEAKRAYLTAVLGPRQSERWRGCIGEMLKPMDMSLGRLFVDADFDESTKHTVKDMTTRIRKAFINNLDSEDWMDSSTKEQAREKAIAIAEDVGYPPYIKNNGKLDSHYSMLTVVDEFFENVVALKQMMIQRQFGTLRHPVNKDKWLDGPATVNAYYVPSQNRIVIFAGILNSPFYKKYYPKYFNYGSLAMIIGHEITHGFDSNGRLFDKNGNVRNWWSTSSTKRFASKAQCLVNQYGFYEVFGENVDGLQTLNENIADNGGIKLAYDAYQSWVDDNEKEGQLPDLGLSVDQLFFIGFAMQWCSVSSRAAALYQLKFDPHTYNKYRVIGPLSNFEKFSDAFGCSSGDRMDVYPRCSVW
ncbi:endothelin-converting enzyme 1-like [Montipora capricornis]|uniref:endothelin-converting enzyme 1-like n=1 Tax=Montipora capricornis TaxID=246305 RepID=UPI0035F151FD